jgi:methionine synthase I (cobalamin-dependent)
VGSDIILTNTFRANRLAIAGHADVSKLDQVNRTGVEISKRAAGTRARVFASIGPSGEPLLSRQVDEASLRANFEQQARALAAGGPDGIVVETMTDIDGYIPICARLASATDRPIWIKANAGLPTLKEGEVVYQTTPAEFVSHLDEPIDAGTSFIGGCCGTNPGFIEALRSRLDT